MEELKRLEYLQLVQKVTSELTNHYDLKDETLAEFLISLSWKSKDLQSFKLKVDEIGGQFPLSFLENIQRLVRMIMPKPYKPKKVKKVVEKVDFPGLSKKDDNSYIKKLMEDEIKELDEHEKGDGAVTSPKSVVGGISRNLSPKQVRHESSDRWDRSSPRYERKRRERSRSPSRHERRNRDRSLSPPRSSRKRNGSRSPPYRRRKEDPLDDVPIVDKIYKGRVTGIKDFGCFVNLIGVRGRVDGLVHISALMSQRVSSTSDVVNPGQEVFVKVLTVIGNRISLSMKSCDQQTGEDLDPKSSRNPDKSLVGPGFKEPLQRTKPVKRMTSPERFEITQLISSGVLDPKDYPGLEDDIIQLQQTTKFEEDLDLDIEITEAEPEFLAGQTKRSLDLSPIKIVKAPEGTLNRAAMQGASLAKERRELRQQEAKNNPDSQELSKPGEWKKKVFKDTSYGKITNMSMREQRESLPIFRLRSTIIQAVEDNQVLVVVGETGSGKVTIFNLDNANDSIPLRGRIFFHRNGRMYATSSCRCNVSGKTSR